MFNIRYTYLKYLAPKTAKVDAKNKKCVLFGIAVPNNEVEKEDIIIRKEPQIFIHVIRGLGIGR